MRERESFVVCYQWASGKENGGEWSKREGRERDILLYVPLLLRYYPGVHICRAQPIFIAHMLVSHRGMVSIDKKRPHINLLRSAEGVVFPWKQI